MFLYFVDRVSGNLGFLMIAGQSLNFIALCP